MRYHLGRTLAHLYRVSSGATRRTQPTSSAAPCVTLSIATRPHDLHTPSRAVHGTNRPHFYRRQQCRHHRHRRYRRAGFLRTAEVKNTSRDIGGLTGTVTLGLRFGRDEVPHLRQRPTARFSTLAGLNAARAFTNITGSTDSTRHVNLSPTRLRPTSTVCGTNSVPWPALWPVRAAPHSTGQVGTPPRPAAMWSGPVQMPLLTHIYHLPQDASYNGVTCSNRHLKVDVQRDVSSSLTINRRKVDSTALD